MSFKLLFLLPASILLFSPKALFSQTEPPKLPKGELAPIYEDFQDLTKKNEEKILKSLPSGIKEDLLKVKSFNEKEYYNLLSESPDYYLRSDWEYFLDPLEKQRFEQQQSIEQTEMHTKALGFLYQNAKSDEQQKIKTQLKKELEKLFDLKEHERRLEVEMLESEIKELRASLDARKNNKNEIINRRLNELIGMGDYLDWD
jgi:hypothetical protein